MPSVTVLGAPLGLCEMMHLGSPGLWGPSSLAAEKEGLTPGLRVTGTLGDQRPSGLPFSCLPAKGAGPGGWEVREQGRGAIAVPAWGAAQTER